MLFLLSANGLEFLKSSNDLWYSATRASGYRIIENVFVGASELYIQDDIVSVLGCTSRQQWCNPAVSGEGQCQPLGSITAAYNGTFPIQHDKQRRTYDWLSMTTASLMPLMSSLVGTLGVSALTARFKVGGSFQGPLPDNQWQLEVQHWFSTSMATLQDAFVATAAGAPYPELRPFFHAPENPQEHSICTNQVCFHS